MTTEHTNGKGGFVAPLPVPTTEAVHAAGFKIAIGIPMERTVSDVAFMQFWQIAQRGWPLARQLYGRKDKNRTKIAQAVLDSDFTHVLMMDLDHLHPADIVERHARWMMDDPDKLVVAGLHFRRGEPYDPCAFVYGSDGKLHAPAQWDDGLYKVDAVGFGSVLFNKKVFQMLDMPWFANDYSLVAQDGWPGEDMWFSYKCRDAGIGIWVDTTTTSPHLITSVVDQHTFKAWLEDHPEQVRIEDAPTQEAAR